MREELLHTAKGAVSRCFADRGEVIADAADFLDLTANCSSRTVALEAEHLAEGFFDLTTRMAGEILQKVSNYRLRLIILGDFGRVESRALQDFIRESNRTGQVVFVADLESGIGLLR